jgi:uncharacterized protein
MKKLQPYSPEQKAFIASTESFVIPRFLLDASGHDWHHVQRVRAMAKSLAQQVGADLFIVEIAALLHDVDDPKLTGNPNATGVVDFLKVENQTNVFIDRIVDIITTLSFTSSQNGKREKTLEGQVVQDADRLDAIGAIGIARAFAFGGSRHRLLYNGDNNDDSSLAHFYQKLIKLPALMNTVTARRIANHRLSFLHRFLREFLVEWNIETQK